MSHKGTVQTFSNRSSFEDCLDAVAACDLFLSLITPQYGSGKDGTELSITHRELLPGELKPGDLSRNHPSLPTNPDIAHVLYLRGLMERIGRGTQEIRLHQSTSFAKHHIAEPAGNAGIGVVRIVADRHTGHCRRVEAEGRAKIRGHIA